MISCEECESLYYEGLERGKMSREKSSRKRKEPSTDDEYDFDESDISDGSQTPSPQAKRIKSANR